VCAIVWNYVTRCILRIPIIDGERERDGGRSYQLVRMCVQREGGWLNSDNFSAQCLCYVMTGSVKCNVLNLTSEPFRTILDRIFGSAIREALFECRGTMLLVKFELITSKLSGLNR